MAKYTYQWRYSSGLGSGNIGDEVEYDDELAAQINNDSPGVLVPSDAKPKKAEAETKAVDEAPNDRMVKEATKRGDRDPNDPITKETHKAVKNP